MSVSPVMLISWGVLSFVLFSALTLVGVWCIYIGRRGRLIDDHPLCRGCRFDLSGTLPAGTHCPECGKGVTSPDAVRIGNRRRRPWMMATGLLLLLPTLGLTGIMATHGLLKVNWQGFKPVWLLQMEAFAIIGKSADASWDELARRQQDGALSAGQVERLVGLVLTIQKDMAGPWNPKAGPIVERAEADRMLTPEQWKQYVKSAMESALNFEIRPRIRIGDPWPYKVRHRSARCSNGQSFLCRIDKATLSIDGGPEVQSHMGSGFPISGNSGNGWSSSSIDARHLPGDLGSGRFDLTVKWQAKVFRTWQDDDNKVAPLVESVLERRCSIELVATDQPTVKGVGDPSLEDAFKAALKVEKVEVRTGSGFELSLILNIKARPTGMSYKFEILDGDQRYPCGTWAAPAQAATSLHTGHQGNGFPQLVGRKVTVVMTPDPEPALRTTDVFEYWDHPLEFPGVEVTARK